MSTPLNPNPKPQHTHARCHPHTRTASSLGTRMPRRVAAAAALSSSACHTAALTVGGHSSSERGRVMLLPRSDRPSPPEAMASELCSDGISFHWQGWRHSEQQLLLR